jgi:ABC-type antimicrobial peptide transport system permease subunit
MGAAGLVLIVACADVGSLQLARARSRQNELQTRLSLGASRPRLIRQLLTESALLGLLAGALALPFTWSLLKFAVILAGEAFPAEYGTLIFDVTPDFEIFAYVLAISLVSGILFGLAPAMESSVMDPKTWTRTWPCLRWRAALKMKESQCPKRERVIRPA